MEKILEINSKHYTVEAVKLNTVTDYTDEVVTRDTTYLFRGNTRGLKGNIFFIKGEKSYSIITFCADFEIAELYVKDFSVYLSECEHIILEGDENAVRRYLLRYAPKRLITMSNTWGDCNGFSRVNSEFVKREIDASRKIGLDIAQIDDGWQKGKTNVRELFDELGRRKFDGDFWETDKNSFPEGLDEMSEYAGDEIELGLWFAPDFHGNFAYYDRDVNILKRASDKFKFFKLDMLHIHNKEDRDKFISMLEELRQIASLELDVTNGQRLGYLISMRYGIIFLENRYTKTANYYPYRTLKNLWELSRYIPAQTLQVELANPDLNIEAYGDDAFKPSEYTMDYLFASVMVSNPLFWMETQFLGENRIKELNNILPLWKSLREEIVKSEIIPIGERPSGTSFTGFMIKGEKTYALVFRENTLLTEYDFNIPSFKVLLSNGEVCNKNGKIAFSKENCYALLEI